MKIKFVGGKRDGKEQEVSEAAGQRLVANGVAEQVSGKATASEDKPKAKKAPVSKAAKKA